MGTLRYAVNARGSAREHWIDRFSLPGNDLTAHLAALICLFSKSHDCGQEVAYLGPVRIPGGKGVYQAQSGDVPTEHSFRAGDGGPRRK
jgi:hypothetical protein